MLCVEIENENQNPHSFMKKCSYVYYSINDCPWNRNVEIVIKVTFADYNFIVKERNHYPWVTHNLALHIETVNLADGDYELVPADSRAEQEVNLNCANLSQDLGQAPEAFLPDSAQEGKPRSIIPLFSELSFTICLLMYCNILFSAFKFSRRWSKTLDAWSLGTYVWYPDLFID